MHANQPDEICLWTLFRSHVEPAMGFGYLAELAGWLEGQNLPGIAPPSWVVEICLEVGETGHLAYTHDAGGPDEWEVVIAPASEHLHHGSR